MIGDHARADMLTALLADRALTASELAGIAGVTKQTASAHLAKLLDAGLIAVEHQGRHRYCRLADRDVAQLLESLMGVAFRTGAVRLAQAEQENRELRAEQARLLGAIGRAKTHRHPDRLDQRPAVAGTRKRHQRSDWGLWRSFRL